MTKAKAGFEFSLREMSFRLESPLHLAGGLFVPWSRSPDLLGASAAEDRLNGLEHDQQVETKRGVLDVIQVILELFA